MYGSDFLGSGSYSSEYDFMIMMVFSSSTETRTHNREKDASLRHLKVGQKFPPASPQMVVLNKLRHKGEFFFFAAAVAERCSRWERWVSVNERVQSRPEITSVVIRRLINNIWTLAAAWKYGQIDD